MQKDDVMVKFYTKPKTIFQMSLYLQSNRDKYRPINNIGYKPLSGA